MESTSTNAVFSLFLFLRSPNQSNRKSKSTYVDLVLLFSYTHNLNLSDFNCLCRTQLRSMSIGRAVTNDELRLIVEFLRTDQNASEQFQERRETRHTHQHPHLQLKIFLHDRITSRVVHQRHRRVQSRVSIDVRVSPTVGHAATRRRKWVQGKIVVIIRLIKATARILRLEGIEKRRSGQWRSLQRTTE